MEIISAESDSQIAACYAVMQELRPHLEEASFVDKIRALGKSGYRLAYVAESGEVVAVAGFRVGESLAWGRYLYVDDLVTRASQRSRGHGAALLSWLSGYAAEQGCQQLHLDSGVQRKQAHRFYERESMQMTSYHYAKYVTR